MRYYLSLIQQQKMYSVHHFYLWFARQLLTKHPRPACSIFYVYTVGLNVMLPFSPVYFTPLQFIILRYTEGKFCAMLLAKFGFTLIGPPGPTIQFTWLGIA